MDGFNWVDLVIALLFIGAIYYGIRLGFLTLLLTFGGFFAAFFLGGWIFPHVLPIHDRTLLAVINGNLVFIGAFFVGFRGYDYGKKLHLSLAKDRTRPARIMESVSGITLSLGSAVVIVWLIAAGIGSLPFVGFSNSVNNANIIQFLDSHLPAAPSVFEVFSKMVDPNTPPQIFTKAMPNSSIGSTVIPSTTTKDEIQAGQSVVRITSFGCGGIVDGSGFVVAPDLIATSAHVIAGVQRPTIKYGSHSISATPVVFDPNLDFAVLRVNGLNIRPLPLYSATITSGAPVDVIGYPGSIFTVTSGVVQKSQQISGTNLYGLGTIVRNVYIVRASVKKGNSGGPVVTSNGYVIGIIFARLKTNGQYAYALTASSISAEVNQAKKISGHIGTGVCFTGN